jgi:uncharacterized damage-inducible protein DinB
MQRLQSLKDHLLCLLAGKGAHVDFEMAIKRLPSKCYGASVKGAPYTLWELIEHIRCAQHDILEYIRNPDYEALDWPEGYWPKTKSPPSQAAWTASIRKIRQDLRTVKALLKDPKTDLFKQIPHAKKGHTILREILLIADHNAYHIGQIVLMRRLLSVWT